LTALLLRKRVIALISKIEAKIRMLGYSFSDSTLSADEGIIDVILDDVLQHIRNFCNLETVTDAMKEELSGYITDRVAGQFVFLKRSTGAMSGMITFEASPASVSEGDTSVSFGSRGVTQEEGYTAELERMRNRSDDELLRFRRLQWQA